ncbi:stage V sporulation protein D [Selenomonadales bacterium OttesenSCG-928-I06]|nr:stage V sporulation protein D [Selenomonadales bacterium OttesenSCG-928-I06]
MPITSHITIRKRIVILFLIVAVIITGLLCRLAYLQFYKSSWLKENAIEQRIREIPVEAKRGKIFDRNGKELAISINAESIYAIPAEIQNAEDTAAKLAAILDLEEDKLKKKLKQRMSFAWLKRRVDSETALKIKTLDIKGIGITQESKRFYPNDNLASHVIGFTGIDNQGLDGVELTFDNYLRGRQGAIIIEYDARGHEIPQANHKYVSPTDGNDIYLTIDVVIQEIVEKALENTLRETQAKSVTIVALDPRDGSILALANKPDYNPNRFSEYSPKLWRNTAVSNVYEPGSTFKIITVASVLGDKVVSLQDRFYDYGGIAVQGRTIHCWKHGGHGSQTFSEVVQNSCNPGFVSCALRLGIDPFYRYIENFGFGQPTNIDLPGEAKGIVIKRENVKPINLATMSIGQSIAVTPIQLITAAAAIANDGTLFRPQILKEVKDKENNIIRPFEKDVVSKVIDKETTNEIKNVLEKVVSLGTGKNAFVDGIKVAGKTGTAQKVGASGYEAGKYVASFIGFAPYDNPKIVMLIIIDEPVGIYYGGQIAAPVFGKVMAEILKYMKDDFNAGIKSNTENTNNTHAKVPNVINLEIPEAIRQLQEAGFNARIEENGSRIADQIPKPHSTIPRGTSILLYTITPRYLTGEITVPDLTHLSLKEAADVLANISLSIETVGYGNIVAKQEPLPNTKLSSGGRVIVYLE